MIGNDIVDLNLAERQSNWQRPGFLEKQFTIQEQYTAKSLAVVITAVSITSQMLSAGFTHWQVIRSQRLQVTHLPRDCPDR